MFIVWGKTIKQHKLKPAKLRPSDLLDRIEQLRTTVWSLRPATFATICA